MFGFGKKQISAEELGQGILQMANDPMASDCGRALGMRFENWDGSSGWTNFLLGKGVALDTQKLHFRLWRHAAIQTFCTRFEERKRRAITLGAMGMIAGTKGYDPHLTLNALEAAFQGKYNFDNKIAALGNSESEISFLPNPQAHLFAAKYLIQEFIVKNMSNASEFLNDFSSYSSALGTSVATASRAVDQIERSFKVV